jgi:hypothetical protein
MHYLAGIGHAIAQAISRWFPAAEAKESPLLEIVTRERLVKTKQTENI